jgi:sulfide:quinone oxidoreductase
VQTQARSRSSTILVLGGGIGGVSCATRLRRRLPQPHRVVLVERDETYVYSPSTLWLMVGDRTRAQVTRSRDALARKGIELVRGNVEALDPAARSVRVDGITYQGDYVVIALGAELAPDLVPGLATAGYDLYSLEGMERLRDARTGFVAGRIAVVVAGLPFKCPAAPNEAAFLLEADLRRRGVRENCEIALYTPEPGPMPVAGPEVSAALRAMLEARGIRYYPEHKLAAVDGSARRMSFANGVDVEFDLLAFVPPHRAPSAAREAGLLSESGWIAVDRNTLATRFPGVFAIGDAAGIPLANGRPLPKAGVLTHAQADVVADNLVREITGKGSARTFDGRGSCFIETGDGRAGFGDGDFFAEPNPRVRLRKPSRSLHVGKILYEKYWLGRWF